MNASGDARRLPAPYRQLHDELVPLVGESRVSCDPLRTLACGTDASFYLFSTRERSASC